MAQLKERVSELLALRNLSQAEAGRRAGFSNSAFINDILRGHKSDVRGKNLTKLAKGLSTSEDYLSGRTNDPAPRRPSLIATFDPDAPEIVGSDPTPTEPSDRIDVRASWPVEAIPELVGKGGFGTGHVIQSKEAGTLNTIDEVKTEYWRIPSDFARGTLGVAPIHLIVVECEGDSMLPTLASGDRVWVNTLHQVPSPDGLYAIRDVFDSIIVKRVEVAQEVPLRLRIISDNPKHNPREVGPDEVRIVGKVVAGLKLF